MHKGKIILRRDIKHFEAGYCIINEGLPELVKRLPLLHEKETGHYNTLKFDRRKLSYLLGRTSAKMSIGEVAEPQMANSFYIDFGIFLFPVVKECNTGNIQVSITHCNNIGLALAFTEEHPLGIDIEKIDEDKIKSIRSQISEKELKLINDLHLNESVGYTLIWTIKEGLSKVFRTGMTADFTFFSIDTLKKEGDFWHSTFAHCIQYKAISYQRGNYICSVILPGNTQAELKDFWFAFNVEAHD